MATSPRWKVYDAEGRYQAACKEIEAAAVLVAWYGNGASIRDYHRAVVWQEGLHGRAGDSYDMVAHTAARKGD